MATHPTKKKKEKKKKNGNSLKDEQNTRENTETRKAKLEQRTNIHESEQRWSSFQHSGRQPRRT